MTVNGDCSTSHLCNVQCRGLDGRYRNGDLREDTSLMVKSSEDTSLRNCERAQMLAFARLQSLVLRYFQ